MVQAVALESAVKDVARDLHYLFIGVGGFQEANEESMSARNSNLVLQRLQDVLLHLKNL
jgi:hypothetical protein